MGREECLSWVRRSRSDEALYRLIDNYSGRELGYKEVLNKPRKADNEPEEWICRGSEFCNFWTELAKKNSPGFEEVWMSECPIEPHGSAPDFDIVLQTNAITNSSVIKIYASDIILRLSFVLNHSLIYWKLWVYEVQSWSQWRIQGGHWAMWHNNVFRHRKKRKTCSPFCVSTIVASENLATPLWNPKYATFSLFL